MDVVYVVGNHTNIAGLHWLSWTGMRTHLGIACPQGSRSRVYLIPIADGDRLLPTQEVTQHIHNFRAFARQWSGSCILDRNFPCEYQSALAGLVEPAP